MAKASAVKIDTAKRKTPGETGVRQKPVRFAHAGSHMASSAL
jgi:hypothetical protein